MTDEKKPLTLEKTAVGAEEPTLLSPPLGMLIGSGPDWMNEGDVVMTAAKLTEPPNPHHDGRLPGQRAVVLAVYPTGTFDRPCVSLRVGSTEPCLYHREDVAGMVSFGELSRAKLKAAAGRRLAEVVKTYIEAEDCRAVDLLGAWQRYQQEASDG